MMNVLRDSIRDVVKYAAEVNDLELTLRTHAEIGDLDEFIEMNELDIATPREHSLKEIVPR